MGKRKQAAPQHAGEEKRQQMEWNMLDNNAGTGSTSAAGSLAVISDNDPVLQKEAEAAAAAASVANTTIPFTYKPSAYKPTTAASDSDATRARSNNAVADSLRSFFRDPRLADMFEDYLSQCVLFVTVHKEQNFREQEWNFEIGRFCLRVQDHPGCAAELQSLPDCEQCWLYLAEKNGRHMIYFEVDGSDEEEPVIVERPKKSAKGRNPLQMFWCVETDIAAPADLFDGMSRRYFQLVLGEYNRERRELEVIIYGRESMLMELSHPSEAFRQKPVHQSVQKLMHHFHSLGPMYDLSWRQKVKRHDFHELYEAVMVLQRRRKKTLDVDVQHASLKPRLRPYQRESVSWMLQQERFTSASSSSETEPNCDLHPLYNEVSTNCGQTVYYNRHGGSILRQKPVKTKVPPGGILADEMGLGKTVEVLCCMLLHPRPPVALPSRLPTLMETQVDSEDEDSQEDSTSLPSRRSSAQEADQTDLIETKDEGGYPEPGADENSISSSAAETVSGEITITPDHNYCHLEPASSGAAETTCVADCKPVVMKEEMHMDLSELAGDSVANTPLSSSVNASVKEENAVMAVEQGAVDAGKASAEKEVISTAEDQASATEEKPIVKEEEPAGTGKPFNGETFAPPSAHSEKTESPTPESLEDPESSLPTADEINQSELQPSTSARPRKGTQKRWTRRKSQTRTVKGSRRKSRSGPSQDDSLTSDDTSLNGGEVKQSDGTTPAEAHTQKQEKKRRSSRYVELVPESEFKEADYFTTGPVAKKQFFECVCGKPRDFYAGRRTRKSRSPYHVVECIDCGVSQHAECLNYDLNDPFRGEYKCPHCHVASRPIPSGATLIISPFQICHQWIEEIQKHVQEKCLKVFVYTGVNKLGFVQPHTLSSQDIVVTTYETLRKELDYVDLPHSNSENGRRFRHPKRFMATPSPIIAVEWWRICLDEAQMVECVTTKTAEMALRLSAVNRWCVTGTPLMRSIEDIYGLLLFLGVDPYWVQQWWRVLLWEPFCHGIQEPMHEALASVLWRTAKKDVLYQIDLPQQTEEVTWLTFSPVEDHFYRHLYQKCFSEAMKNLGGRTDLSTKLNTLDRRTVATLLRPLLNLRQACCHPQAVRGAFIPVQESMLTMEELLESLIKKARLECEEAHRLLVAALNGLAALQLIRQQPGEAVELYREVLRSVEEHKDELRTDDLQQLHAMYNLQEILATKPQGVAPTLRDDLLSKQCGELRERYMAKARVYTNTSREQLLPLQQTVRELEQELEDGSDWWLEVLATASERHLEEELVHKVREDLLENTRAALLKLVYQFRDIRGLQYVVQTHLVDLEAARRRLVADLKKLDKKGGLTQDIINKTVECCLRPAGAILKDCPFCKLHQLFEEYESKLFLFLDGGAGAGGEAEDPMYLVHTRRQGTWADSELEKALKSLISFARSNRVHSDILQYGATHLRLFDGWKKEFKQLRVLWMALREEVSSVDELDMATMRLRVRLPEEPAPEMPQPNILEATELDAHRLKLMSDRTVNRGELRKKLGQLMYLKNLAKSQENMKEGKNPDPCPVCQRELGREWSVLQCGHCYCMDCIHILVGRFRVGNRCLSLKCPLCREVTHEGEISYVSTKQDAASDTSPSVKGSHSTKVSAVVQCLLNIKQVEPQAKALVFSTWTDVLDVIGKALQENDITYTALHTTGKFQRNLTAFRERDEMQVLLLPFHSGANGLNLIEATHVLLVEPILNAAQEAQAIGRVHRIGQTRPTKIHRFMVRRTIEERIHGLMETTLRPAAASTDTTASADDNAMTIGQLVSLFQDTLGSARGDDGDEAGEEEEEAGEDDGGEGWRVGGPVGEGAGSSTSPGDSNRVAPGSTCQVGGSSTTNATSSTVAASGTRAPSIEGPSTSTGGSGGTSVSSVGFDSTRSSYSAADASAVLGTAASSDAGGSRCDSGDASASTSREG